MSSNNRLIFILFILTFSLNFSFASKQEDIKYKNDFMMLMALDFEKQNNYIQSAAIYHELFKKNNTVEYLNKTIINYFKAKQYEAIIDLIEKNIKNFEDHEEFLRQQYVLSAILLKEYEKALQFAKPLIMKFPSAKNELVVADLYYMLKQYNHAKKYYLSAYEKNHSPLTLVALSDLLFQYMDKKDLAIEYLENHIKDTCDLTVCSKLIFYYQETNQVSKMIALLEKTYYTYKDKLSQKKLHSIENFMVALYEKIDIKKAISFLEDTQSNFAKLLQLYGVTKQYNKALELVMKEYKKTKDKFLLGQVGILTFETAKDKASVINEVLKNLKIALSVKDDANYQNYYGYLLIDYDIDVALGLEHVKKALKLDPKNLSYMDSVAWGLYKLNNCEEAYKYIKQVVDETGLSHEEIKYHFDQIKGCNDIR